MNLLFIRGRLPLDFRPDRLEYDQIDQCEDMWAVLAERLSRHFNKTQLWYWGSGEKAKVKKVTDKFTEVWMNEKSLPEFKPDIIIARGGFNENWGICKKFPDAKKVYYGAGVRYKPQKGNWDLILVDSAKQQKKIPGSKLFVKPAADNLFYPMDVEKKYDVCFMANATQMDIKRHKLAFNSLRNFKVLHLGLSNDKIKGYKNVTVGGWHRRRKLPKLISQCRVGLICSTDYDSCPRVLTEYLACGIPVVATRNMNFWHEKYVNPDTGILCGDDDIAKSIRKVLDGSYLNVYNYYKNNLSVDISTDMLLGCLREIK